MILGLWGAIGRFCVREIRLGRCGASSHLDRVRVSVAWMPACPSARASVSWSDELDPRLRHCRYASARGGRRVMSCSHNPGKEAKPPHEQGDYKEQGSWCAFLAEIRQR